MGSCIYVVENSVAIALAAATPKVILNARVPAAEVWGYNLRGFTVGFDGVTAANVPVLVELFTGSGNAGTAGAFITPRQLAGRAIAASANSSGENYSVAPSGLVVLKEYTLTPNGGLLVVTFPADKMFDTPGDTLAGYFGLRCTAPNVVNVWGTIEVERT